MAMRYASLVMKSNSIAFAKKVNMKPDFLKIALAMMMANADPEEKEKLMKVLSPIQVLSGVVLTVVSLLISAKVVKPTTLPM